MSSITSNEKGNEDFEKQEANKIIQRQLRFQNLLISISTKYINSDLSNIDELVNTSLKQIGEFVQADRSYVFSYDFINNTSSNTYEWCAKGIIPEIENLQNLSIEYITHWLDAHRKGQAFYVEDVSKLPKDGDLGLRAILEPQGIQSLITIPKIKNNELIGFIGFDSVRKINKYTENEQEILFVYANMLVNVIQRKEHEEVIRKQEEKKEELLKSLSHQNDELNKYAHAVSHDLKAPLINVQTLIDWFIEDHKDTIQEDFSELLKEISLNVEKMNLLIKGILDYSTIDRLENDDRDIDFNSLLNGVLKSLKIPEHITIKVHENLPTVYGNIWRFKQVFVNLIDNAIKYSNKEKGIIEVGVTDKNEYYEFFVKDNGIGINSDYFDRIFKVFTKLESTSLSSGVGLSIVKKIVNYYNGKIWIESELGSGTTFYFTILK
ncbi:histidine kinase [Polaribacter reichenbachii]|uniref:histidine kinase n=1 Tax=Polaribacter reichenbachii TaxID=996801 RepID=A0A1B8U6W4_9FLAO|nr:ATP-binding protein [Polaribacter reichenbachii]APZ46288.1 histidine kinase [Polaribacter reichenbachii]AUC20151.1 histidine kinase [Polaribacter reichenbachii]OBY67590.1 histidine kinase [Polaribacter reichenbachii]